MARGAVRGASRGQGCRPRASMLWTIALALPREETQGAPELERMRPRNATDTIRRRTGKAEWGDLTGPGLPRPTRRSQGRVG
jgi:hypothetical protein